MHFKKILCALIQRRVTGMARVATGIIFAVAAVHSPQPLAVEEDVQAWFATFATKALDDRWIAYMEVQGRFGDDIGRLSQTLLRPAVGYRLSSNMSIWAGYGYIETERVNADDIQEHRIWQQALWNAGEVFGAAVTSRTRLEQRLIESADDTGWRLRQFVKFSRPFENNVDLNAVTYVEGFFALNDTDWGAEAGFDQLRLFAGIGREIARGVRFEGGYLNQYIRSPRGSDRANHILSINFFLDF